MRKWKNGARRIRRWILRWFFLLVMGFFSVLFAPTVYAFVTYYHVPENNLEAGTSILYSMIPHEMCINTYVGGGIIPNELTFKFVIDDRVVPFSEVIVYDVDGFVYDLFHPYPDFVCTTQPNLSVGEHELEVFTYRGSYDFQWVPHRRIQFTVDDAGMIS